MQAKCFLGDNYWNPDKVYHEAKGDYVAGFRGNKAVWKTEYYWHGGGTKVKINRTYDTISAALHAGGVKLQKIYLGGTHDGTTKFGHNTLYLVGSRDDVLKMLFDANVAPEVVVVPKVYIGVFHWQHTFGPDRIGVRIHASSHRPKAVVNGFRDFEVTSDVGCGGGPAWTTVHPAAFHGPLKNFLDKNKIQ